MSTKEQPEWESTGAPPSVGGEGPTLVVGVGAFGAEIVERLEAAQQGRAGGLGLRAVLLALRPAEPVAEQAQRIVREAEGLLGLGAAVRGSEPGDSRRPMLDVFLVGDLADAEVAERLPPLLGRAANALLRRFSNIFPGHDLPNLSVCPVVALLGVREPGASVDPGKALGELEAQAGRIGFRAGSVSPVARIFVVEQQASRYELTRGEVASTVLAFMSLLLGTALRHQEPLRSFLRSSIDHRRQQRPFASFGCATLELNLVPYCVARAAGDLVTAVRAAAGAAAGDQSVAAERLVPDAATLERAIQSPKSGDDLVALLRAHTPHIDFPRIGWRDSPEQIREVSYGWGWFDALDSAVKAQVERLDEREMDEVTRVADERGLRQLRALEREVRQAIRGAEGTGPGGWAEGLRLARFVRTRAERQITRLGESLKREKLPEFPSPSGVESAFRELRAESTLRPRPGRMAFFGALSAVALAALLHYLPKWIAVALVWRKVPILSLAPSSMDVYAGRLWWLLDPPYAFFWMLLAFGAGVFAWLRRVRRKRHEALLAAQTDLQSAVGRYLSDEVGPSIRRYYESRLSFTLQAWALRALRRVREVADREAERLGAVGAALDRLGRQFEAEAQKAERAEGAEAGDLVYRTAASSELLRGSYDALRPTGALADKLFAEIEPPERDDEPPEYLLEERLRAFVRPFVEPSEKLLEDHAGPVVEQFVAQLHGKLGVPLEVRSFDEGTGEQHYLFAPAWAGSTLARLRERLPTLPEPQTHDDPDRVHLLTVQTALGHEHIALPAPGSTPRKGGAE